MKLYTLSENRLKSVDNHSFKLEKEIQTLVENNLDELFNLEFVKSELRIKNFRLDTLAYDQENKSFVIIEYKKERNFSVIDQGYTYMSILLNNKADFILEYHDHCGITLKRDEVDWSQSKVLFISPYFTEYQKNSINFKDVPFELWEIKRYANGLISLYNHKVDSQETIATISKDPENVVSEVSREIKKYTEEDHFNRRKTRDESIPELYRQLKERILNLGDVEILPRKKYISFRRKSPFADIIFYAHHLRVVLNLKSGELDDPKNLTKNLSEQGHWGNGDYDIIITPDSDLDYVMFLVNQSFKKQEA
jgi:predicted transport protein